MKKSAYLAASLFLLFAAVPADAQIRGPQTWVSGWIGGFPDPGTVNSTDHNWEFGATMAGGLAVHRQVGNLLQLGVETTLAPSVSYELSPKEDGEAIRGSGTIGSAMGTARLRYGGGGDFGLYFKGGAGTFLYRIPDLDGWDPDFALFTGAGLEYRLNLYRSLFVEWGRYMTFHQNEGVGSNTVRHSTIRVGGRLGL